MTDKINELLRRVEEFNPKAAAEIEEFRIKILGKKGELNALMEDFKTVAPELKRELGQQLNKLKTTALDRINSLREQLQEAASDDGAATEDMTRPGSAEQLGSRHPISLVKNQIVEVFSRLGYTVADGPEIEDDWHMVIKMTRKGRRYYGCIDYPECDFMSWGRPVEKKCPRCGGYMVEKGNKLACADEHCGYTEAKEKETE